MSAKLKRKFNHSSFVNEKIAWFLSLLQISSLSHLTSTIFKIFIKIDLKNHSVINILNGVFKTLTVSSPKYS